MAAKHALVVIADGSESLEAITIINVLRRAEIQVTVATLTSSLNVSTTLGVQLTADTTLEEVAHQTFDAIVLPGGFDGAKALAADATLDSMLRAQRQAHRYIAAICASPALVLSEKGLLDGKQATGYPTLRDNILHYVNLPVVVDGHTITGQGPASSITFALTLVECLSDFNTYHQVKSGLLA